MNYLLLICFSPFIINSSLCWQYVGFGINYKTIDINDFSSNNILITYAGYNVNQDQTQSWTERLLAKSILSNSSIGIKHVYAVRGPKDSLYSAKEIENSKLITHLYSVVQNQQLAVNRVIIIAHSSGSFVADEFFHQLFNKLVLNPNDGIYSALIRKIHFYNLDGATIPSRKDDLYLKILFSKIHFVWSSKAPLKSMNADTMILAPAKYPNNENSINSIEIKANTSGCLNSRCLHNVVIIEDPWDVLNFDTAKDYTLFSSNGREVQSEYLVKTLSHLLPI
jgi:hypothetical protein